MSEADVQPEAPPSEPEKRVIGKFIWYMIVKSVWLWVDPPARQERSSKLNEWQNCLSWKWTQLVSVQAIFAVSLLFDQLTTGHNVTCELTISEVNWCIWNCWESIYWMGSNHWWCLLTYILHSFTGKLQNLSELSWIAWSFCLVLCCLKARHHWKNASTFECLSRQETIQLCSTSPWICSKIEWRLVTRIIRSWNIFISKKVHL